MSSRPCVLIVDKSAETREVLRTALQRQGTEILEAGRTEQGLQLARQHKPDLIILDLDILDIDDGNITSGENAEGTVSTRPEDFSDLVEGGCTPIVVLGNLRRQAKCLPTGEFVAKPYHYGPLVRKIENLLARGRQA